MIAMSSTGGGDHWSWSPVHVYRHAYLLLSGPVCESGHHSDFPTLWRYTDIYNARSVAHMLVGKLATSSVTSYNDATMPINPVFLTAAMIQSERFHATARHGRQREWRWTNRSLYSRWLTDAVGNSRDLLDMTAAVASSYHSSPSLSLQYYMPMR